MVGLVMEYLPVATGCWVGASMPSFHPVGGVVEWSCDFDQYNLATINITRICGPVVAITGVKWPVCPTSFDQPGMYISLAPGADATGPDVNILQVDVDAMYTRVAICLSSNFVCVRTVHIMHSGHTSKPSAPPLAVCVWTDSADACSGPEVIVDKDRETILDTPQSRRSANAGTGAS